MSLQCVDKPHGQPAAWAGENREKHGRPSRLIVQASLQCTRAAQLKRSSKILKLSRERQRHGWKGTREEGGEEEQAVQAQTKEGESEKSDENEREREGESKRSG
jgi:hypothetical protein